MSDEAPPRLARSLDTAIKLLIKVSGECDELANALEAIIDASEQGDWHEAPADLLRRIDEARAVLGKTRFRP